MLTTERFWRTLMSQILVGVAGACAQGNSSGQTEQVLEVSMEAGGNCSGTIDFPCWSKTSVLPAKIRLEISDETSMESAIVPDDFQRIVQIVNRADFRSAITAKAPTCPVTFDADCILTLTTSTGTFTDKFASGCVLDDTTFPGHSYRDLVYLLDEMRKSHFPGALPY